MQLTQDIGTAEEYLYDKTLRNDGFEINICVQNYFKKVFQLFYSVYRVSSLVKISITIRCYCNFCFTKIITIKKCLISQIFTC